MKFLDETKIFVKSGDGGDGDSTLGTNDIGVGDTNTDNDTDDVVTAADGGACKAMMTGAASQPPPLSQSGLQRIQKPNRPRALVLVPTRELVQQVIGVSKMLCHDAPFHAVGLHHGEKRCGTDLVAGADIVVGVPSKVALLRKKVHACSFRSEFNVFVPL